MFCSQCGQQIDDDSRFCRFCGAKQSASVEAPTTDAVQAASLVQPEPGDGSATAPAADLDQPVHKDKIALLMIAGALVLVILIFVSMPKKDPGQAALDNLTELAGDNITAVDALMAADAKPTPETGSGPNWTYSETEDKIRGKKSFTAVTDSKNSINQDPPYGSSGLTLTLRKSPAYGIDAILQLDSGQLLCPSYDGCYGTISIDGGTPQRVYFNGAADYSPNVIFFRSAQSVIAKLKKAKKLVVEVEVYQNGRPQFEFDVAGLEWTHS